MTEFRIVGTMESSKDEYFRLEAKLQGKPLIVVDEETGVTSVYP